MIKNIIAVAAGKGGVGKTSISLLIAELLKKRGHAVGLFDADLYGPSIGCLLQPDSTPYNKEAKVVPAICRGIKYISSAFFGYDKNPATIRAPVANQMINQFIHQVEWGFLDYMIVDFPPGTGDIQLTLMQQLKFDGAILVSTPQLVALKDVEKAYLMFSSMNVEVLGLLENMSFLDLPKKIYPFGKGNSKTFCIENKIELLGQLPIDESLSKGLDENKSLVLEASKRTVEILDKALGKVLDKLAKVEPSIERVVWDRGCTSFSIIWKSGRKQTFDLNTVQSHCPCSRCSKKNQHTKNESLSVFSIEEVGMYALQVEFNFGCSKGVYPFTLLKKLGVDSD